jgi:hypothetical protein
MILYSHQIFEIISPFLGVFEKKDPHREKGQANGESGF